MKSFHLTVSSVVEAKFDGEAYALQVPGAEGEMEVLADHEPMITTLKEGTLTIKTDEGEESLDVKKGILEVANNRAVVLL
jgi:F-type H+-transporting ATPase subunit epsilon